MALLSDISSIVANKLGKLQGDLDASITEEAFKQLEKFSNQCPSPEELIKIAKTQNALQGTINNFQKVTNEFSKIPRTLNPLIRIITRLIKVSKRDPTPLALGISPGMSGGLISAKTTGYAVRKSVRLHKLIELLEALQEDAETVQELVDEISPGLDEIRDTLTSVNFNITDCVKELIANTNLNSIQVPININGNIQGVDTTGNLQGVDNTITNTNTTRGTFNNNSALIEELKILIKEIQPTEAITLGSTPTQDFTHRGTNGKDYVLAILTEEQGVNPVPRRYAVAKDSIGVIILKGEPSFSSNTQILLDELKFRIDNQLP